MASFILLILDIWVLTGLVLFLHYRHPRFGFTLFFMTIGALIVFIQGQLGIFIEPFPGFIMFLSSNVLVPVVLAAVLVLYVTNGAVQARYFIMGILGVSLLLLLIQGVYRQHLLLPAGGSLNQMLTRDLLPSYNVRTAVASLISFTADVFVIAVFYQGIKNLNPRWPDWLIVGLALTGSLWTDAIVFRIVSDLGTRDFVDLLPGDLLGKTISSIILWPLVAGYLVRIAPQLPDYVGGCNRPTFDLLTGSFEEIKQALKHTQAALAQSEKRRREQNMYFDQIANHISEALWLTEPDNHHAFYINRAYEQIWGRSAATLYAEPLSFVEAIHPEDKERVMAALPTQRLGGYEMEYRVVRPDGTLRWVRDQAFPIRDDAGKVYRIAGISEDITERKQLEKRQLDLAIERERVKLLRDFINEASHDLKSPLTAINLKIHRLMHTEGVEKRQILLGELLMLSERIGSLVEDLLTLARLENRGPLVMSPLDGAAMVEAIWQHLRPLADEKDVQVVFDLAEARPLLEMDADDLERALANLIDNGIHYTPPGGTLKVSYRVEDEIVFQVSDTGIGINKEDLPLIFNRFYRATNAQSVDPGGTGLGLAIVKKIVDQHRGRIEVTSTVGIGTTFTIRLPCADVA